MSNLYKTSIINLKNTAHLQPRYDSDIVFSTADENGDFLRFQLLTKAGKPYITGNVNVGGKIKLDHEDGSFWIDDLTVIENELKYQFEYQMPYDLLKRDGKVTAQVLIYEKGNSNLSVAQREFTFNVQNSIYQNITAEDKITHIVEFAELKQEIKQTVVDINEALENGEDFVTQIKTEHKDALDAIETLTTSTTDELNNLGAERLKEIQDTASDYLSQIDTKNADAQKMIDDFKDYLVGQDVVLVSDTEDWQKFKLTEDEGYFKQVEDIDLETVDETLSPGHYWVSNGINTPVKANGFLTLKQGTSSNSYMKAIYEPFNTDEIYIRTKNSDEGWTEWSKISLSDPNDPLETVSGSQEKATTAEINAREYTDSRSQVLFEGDVIGAGQKIKLTKPISDYKFIIVSGYNPAQNFSQIFATNQFETPSMILTSVNLRDADGELVTIYESAIRKNNDTEIEIVTDIFYDFFKKSNSAGNVERWHFNRIEGIK